LNFYDENLVDYHSQKIPIFQVLQSGIQDQQILFLLDFNRFFQ